MKLISKRLPTEKLVIAVNVETVRRYKAYVKLAKTREDLHIPIVEELEKSLVKTMDKFDREMKEIDHSNGASS